jgi:ribosomal-protein-alanine N-acetyltransferase
MERTPYRREMDRALATLNVRPPTASPLVTSDWKSGLPVLTGHRVTLREMRVSDAPSLFAMLTSDDVARFISPPPMTVDGFERFIVWANRERAAGNHACFAIVPHGTETAVGLIQARQLEPGWGTAEWGFVIGSPYWGTGIFYEGSQMVLDFVFETIGVHRLEARSAVHNGRGNGAIRKLGAVQEGILRRSFLRNGQYVDEALWAILADDWRIRRNMIFLTVH